MAASNVIAFPGKRHIGLVTGTSRAKLISFPETRAARQRIRNRITKLKAIERMPGAQRQAWFLAQLQAKFRGWPR